MSGQTLTSRTGSMPVRCPRCDGVGLQLVTGFRVVEDETVPEAGTKIPGEPPRDVQIIKEVELSSMVLVCTACEAERPVDFARD